MGADTGILQMNLAETQSRAGAMVPDLSPVYKSTVAQSKQYTGIVIGAINKAREDLKKEEADNKAGVEAQLKQWRENIDKVQVKLFENKENMDDAVIETILSNIAGMTEVFDDHNTYGEKDTKENRRKRNEMNGELQKIITGAVGMRGGFGVIKVNMDNLNAGVIKDDDETKAAGKMIDMDNWKENGVTVSINDKKEFVMNYQGVSKTMPELIKMFPPIDATIDGKLLELANKNIADSQAAALEKEGDPFNLNKTQSDIGFEIQTKEDAQNIMDRKIQGFDMDFTFKSALIDHPEINIEALKPLGLESEVLSLLGKLNTVDDGVIDEKDMAGALDVDAYKKNMKTLINTITDIEHKNFSLPLTKALQEEFFADLLRQESEENYKEKVERGGSSRTPMSAGMVYQLEQEQKTADATIKALNSGATTIGTFSGPNVQLVGELWVFKNEGSIAGTIPKDTPKAELDQAIMNHMTGTIGKYTVTIPEPE